MVKKLSDKLFKRIYSLVPRFCVEVIIKDKRGIVLIKRDIKPCKGMWHFPGSTVLFGENTLECAKRIAKEETGLDIKIVKFLWFYEYSKEVSFGQGLGIGYLAYPIKGKLKGNKYGKDVRFFKKLPKNLIKEQKDLFYKYVKMN